MAKGSLTSFNCDVTLDASGNPANGFTMTAQYILGANGEPVTVVDGQGHWLRSNVYANGGALATYDGNGLHYNLADALGTKRVQAFLQMNSSGALSVTAEQSCWSLPFGDALNCTGSGSDDNKLHYTGKERDTESGNDYFGARYYTSTMGRFLSPDPIIMNSLRLINPQRWNKYSYAINNPVVYDDPSGKDAALVTFTTGIPLVGHDGILSVHSDGSVTFAEYGPLGGKRAYGVGAVHELTSTDNRLPSLQFGGDGLPTSASLHSLKQTLANEEKVSSSSINIDYFKTSPAETAALDEYIAQWKALADAGKLTYFFASGANCAGFCMRGLQAAGVKISSGPIGPVLIPNVMMLQGWFDIMSNHQENVTVTVDNTNCSSGC